MRFEPLKSEVMNWRGEWRKHREKWWLKEFEQGELRKHKIALRGRLNQTIFESLKKRNKKKLATEQE